MLAGVESASDEEASDDEGALAVESPKRKEDDVVPELGEPDAGAEGVVLEPEDVAVHENPAAGAEDIAKD